jgi:hypothetical protein
MRQKAEATVGCTCLDEKNEYNGVSVGEERHTVMRKTFLHILD